VPVADRRYDMIKWLLRLLGIAFNLGFALLVALVAGRAWLDGSLPDYHGERTLAGIDGEVTVIRDRNAIPHIFAGSETDAAFALGYAHAQDRLWQMEMLRRLGQGRLSEIAGEATLGVDKLVRTLGFYRQAEAIAARLDDDVAAYVAAYAAGVNAFRDNHDGPLPPEFLIAGIEPEPWRPADSIVWGKVMTLQLSGNWFSERLRLLLSARLRPGQIDDLWPDTAAGAPRTLAALAPLHRTIAALAGDATIPPAVGEPGFSNEWVVDGTRTDTGRPLLANDPHLGYQAPNLWYLARVETPTLRLVGATVPGVPLLLIGHNGRVAWGLTTTHGDVSDLFIERIVPGDETRYLTPDGSATFATRQEVIKVKGAEPVIWTVRATRHGPVVSDLWTEENLPIEAGHVLALQAAFLGDGDTTAQALFRMNRARDGVSFRAALREYHAPQQNLVYADVAGNIGFIAPGRVPVRRRGDGFVPVPGWTDDYAWTGFVPFDDLPQGMNPARGWYANANNAVVPDDYPHFIGREWDNAYRAARIQAVLETTRPLGMDTMTALQNDRLSLAAADLLPKLLHARPATDAALTAINRLAEWDYMMDADAVEPTLFIAWLREINRALYADELGPLFDRYWGLRPEVVDHMLILAPEWCDDVTTGREEDCDSRLEIALERAVERLARDYGPALDQWTWGRVHRAVFDHQIFGAIPIVREIANLSAPAPGGPFTLLRANIRVRDENDPFAAVHGAGLRAVFDFADLSNSRFIQATGQSGNVLSHHYGDLFGLWAAGGYLTIAGGRDTLAKDALGVLTLAPGGTD